jgi:ABC-type molybdenum transport system ATPase subunit/photorepair protein PhrA
LGWDPVAHRGLKYLSTGEWRKTMLIRSLARDYLLWEAPLEGLDRQSKAFLRGHWSDLGIKKLVLLFHHRREIPQELILRSGMAENCSLHRHA